MFHLPRGTRVGDDFRVVKPLGVGGMGTVYLVEQQSTGKLRALKVMHQLLMEDPHQQERFVQEARVGARIASDHVVEVIAAGVDRTTGMPWIAMELLDGEDLERLVQRSGPLSTPQVGGVYEQLCHALGAAHASGIIHRDIKPQNVFLARARSTAVTTAIKVLDFGIAKVIAGTKTTATAMVGSPAWMAPEQTDPEASIGPATDVWSLGLMAFWLLTGRCYWNAAEDPRASMQALMKEVLFDPLVPASERAAERTVGTRLPPGFDDWFRRCVRRKPEGRFADAAELGKALGEVISERGPLPEILAKPMDHENRDAVAMSTRSFIESADLDVPPSKDVSELALRSTRALSDSADLDSPSMLASEPRLGDTDSTQPPAAPLVQATAVTPAALSRKLANAAAPRTLRTGDAALSERRARIAPYLLSAVVGATIVGAATWLAQRNDVAESPAAPFASTLPPSGSPPPTVASAASAAAAPPPAPRWSSGAFAGANPQHFNASAWMQTAQGVARRQIADAELMMFTTYGIDAEGFTDLRVPGHNAIWTFRSPARLDCLSLVATSSGVEAQRLNSVSCRGGAIRLPRCTTAQAVRKALLSDSMRVVSADAALLTYYADKNGKDPIWAYTIGSFTNSRISDDCGTR